MTSDLLLYNKNLPHQVMRKVEDKEKASTVEADNKVKEESLAVAGGRCWKWVSLRALKKTGELNYFYGLKDKISSSETLVLPIVTLLLIVAYSTVAIIFYMDG